MEFITSNKGSVKLCLDGHAYTKKKESKTTIRWECSKRGSLKCKGALVTDLQATDITSSTTHSHDGDHFQIDALKLRSSIKTSVQSSRGQPGQIIADQFHTAPVKVRIAAGHIASIKRSARRSKCANAPPEPASRNDIPNPLPDQYQTTGGVDASPFILYDNACDSNRIIVFGTDGGLKLLAENDTWFMDGTFDTAPTQFEQLFVIRVHMDDTAVSAVYALLPSKCQSVYEECFSGLLDACLLRDIRPTPSTIVTDFELGIHNAAKSMFGDVNIRGCFYHLTQSTWRKVQAEGLSTQYAADDDLKQFVGMVDGLAFLPVENVKEGMDALKEIAPDCLAPVLDYFDSTYVSGGYKSVRAPNGAIRMRRTQPRFPPPTWNVNEVTINDGDRTNNICESWNNSFKHLVGHSNPSLWTVIACLQKDQTLVETELERRGVTKINFTI